MQKTKLCTEIPATIAGVIIVPIVRVTSNCWINSQVTSFSGIKQPVGVIVISPLYKKCFEMNGEEVPIERFIQENQGIGMSLEAISNIII